MANHNTPFLFLMNSVKSHNTTPKWMTLVYLLCSVQQYNLHQFCKFNPLHVVTEETKTVTQSHLVQAPIIDVTNNV